jgi:hypothetical protein
MKKLLFILAAGVLASGLTASAQTFTTFPSSTTVSVPIFTFNGIRPMTIPAVVVRDQTFDTYAIGNTASWTLVGDYLDWFNVLGGGITLSWIPAVGQVPDGQATTIVGNFVSVRFTTQWLWTAEGTSGPYFTIPHGPESFDGVSAPGAGNGGAPITLDGTTSGFGSKNVYMGAQFTTAHNQQRGSYSGVSSITVAYF